MGLNCDACVRHSRCIHCTAVAELGGQRYRLKSGERAVHTAITYIHTYICASVSSRPILMSTTATSTNETQRRNNTSCQHRNKAKQQNKTTKQNKIKQRATLTPDFRQGFCCCCRTGGTRRPCTASSRSCPGSPSGSRRARSCRWPNGPESRRGRASRTPSASSACGPPSPPRLGRRRRALGSVFIFSRRAHQSRFLRVSRVIFVYFTGGGNA